MNLVQETRTNMDQDTRVAHELGTGDKDEHRPGYESKDEQEPGYES